MCGGDLLRCLDLLLWLLLRCLSLLRLLRLSFLCLCLSLEDRLLCFLSRDLLRLCLLRDELPFLSRLLLFDLDLERLDRDFFLECDVRLVRDLDLDLDRFLLDCPSVDGLLSSLTSLLVSFSGSSSCSSSSFSSCLSGDGEAEADLLLWEDPEECEDDLALGGMSSSCQRQNLLLIPSILVFNS